MDNYKNRLISRRRLLAYSASLPLAGTAAHISFADNNTAQNPIFTLTPSQTEGPFYPRSKPDDVDNDLTAFGPSGHKALGSTLLLTGKVMDQFGAPVSSARVEVWHCDQMGQYHHVGADSPQDDNFQGYGETLSGSEGDYRFRTIEPGIYPGRTRHIHFKVVAPGRRPLTSQLYFESDMEDNMRDGLYRRLSRAQKKALTVNTKPILGKSAQLEGNFNIVLT